MASTNGSGESAADGDPSSSAPSPRPPVRRTRGPRSTNPKADLPLRALRELPDVLSDDEAAALAHAIDRQRYRDWCWEGYDRRHRVQRYASSDGGGGVDGAGEGGGASTEEAFGWIFDRIASHAHLEKDERGNDGHASPAVLRRPFEVTVVEHTPSSCRSVVNTYEYERNDLAPCRGKEESDGSRSSCNCYVAHLTLVNNAVQSIEKPLRRELDCWDLAHPAEHHETNLVMERNGVIIKRGEILSDWRGRISYVQEKGDAEGDADADALCNEMGVMNVEKKKNKQWTRTKKLKASNKRCIIVTFRGLQQSKSDEPSREVKISMPQEVKPLSPLSELLTIVVTTSPIRSHPSTEMLEQTFDTFQFAGDEFAYECPKVIVCDGCRVLDEDNNDGEEKKDETNPPKITRKYANIKQTLRNGIATAGQADNYKEFKAGLRKLCDEANKPSEKKSPFRNARVVELEERHGYGFALRHALCHCVDTPYVCVIQHDRTFLRPTPIKEVVAAMDNDAEQKVKYVGVSMRSNMMYFDIFSGKYGKRAVDEFRTMNLYPRELRIGDGIYGPDGKSVNEMLPPRTEKHRKNREALKATYRGSHQFLTYREWLDLQPGGGNEGGFHQLSLTPTLFWYDNTHIVSTAHYRDFIFNPQYKMVARGGFVEDKLSPCITRNCERLGLTDGHAKFGCYLLDDHSGAVFTGHIDGGSFVTANIHDKNDKYAAKKFVHGG